MLFNELVIHLTCLTFGVYSQRAAQKLNNDLLMNYDPMSRPVENTTTVTSVCVGLYVLQIVDLSEKSQVICSFMLFFFVFFLCYVT